MENKKQKKQDLENTKEFLLEFFKDSNIEEKDGVMIVSNVSGNFENFVGKKAPYKFVFDINLHNKINNSELIMQGSYFLLAIRDYLSDKAQTTLLKINVKKDIDSIKKNHLFKKYKVVNLEEKERGYIYRFSFLSRYEYLNNKKQSINTLVVKDGEITNLDLSNIKANDDHEKNIENLDLEEQYNFAKKKLNEKIKEETKSIKESLREKLKKSLFRIKDHYLKQINEKDEELESCANKIKMLQAKLRHTTYDRDINILNRMIRESKARLEMLEKKGYRERLKAEEAFHINDEVEKHVLSIKNSLINLTIFHYPIYHLTTLKNKKKIIMKYDPVLDKMIK